jgi:tRNA(Ile)-lysidine synthase
MIKQLMKIPHEVCLAFSGGVDSLAVAHFLKRGGKNVTLLHFNHGCQYSDTIQQQCEARASFLGCRMLSMAMPEGECPKGQSIEDYWRRARYNALRKYANSVEQKLITCHHLDDAVETWIWSSMHGEGKVIPAEDATVIRPFLTTEKAEFVSYAERHGLTPVDDPYNNELDLTRNYIRHVMMPHVLKINPGIKKVVRKKYL